MSWTRLDDGMGDHRKIRRALRAGGLSAFGLHILGLLHCSRYLTDGQVEPEFLEDTFDAARTRERDQATIVQALEKHGLWIPDENGGWRVHDYLEHNPSRERVEALRGVDRLRKELTRDHALIDAIRERDGDTCRYCGVTVNWKDRRSNIGGTYDHVTPISQGGGNTFENVVVACRGCNGRKASRSPEHAEMNLAEPSPRSSRGPDRPSRNGQVRSRPTPTPTPTPTPNGPPVAPRGGRDRDRQAFDEQLRSYAAAVLPDAHPSEAFDAVRAAIAVVSARTEPTTEAVLAKVRELRPDLVPEAA